MDDNYIVINGVRYDVIDEENTSICKSCDLNFGDSSCFTPCTVFEEILDKSIIFKKHG